MDIHKFFARFNKEFRTRRMQFFQDHFSIEKQNILDIGGTENNWKLISKTPNVTLLNMREHKGLRENRFEYVIGDATNLSYLDNSFEIAYSNSVIEHVGNWEKQVEFAKEVRRVAPQYYVQTPNRNFFIEPHFIAPFIHWFSKPTQKKVYKFLSLRYWISGENEDFFENLVDEVELLNEKQLRQLFPDALIVKERFLFMTKSLIAIRAT